MQIYVENAPIPGHICKIYMKMPWVRVKVKNIHHLNGIYIYIHTHILYNKRFFKIPLYENSTFSGFHSLFRGCHQFYSAPTHTSTRRQSGAEAKKTRCKKITLLYSSRRKEQKHVDKSTRQTSFLKRYIQSCTIATSTRKRKSRKEIWWPEGVIGEAIR